MGKKISLLLIMSWMFWGLIQISSSGVDRLQNIPQENDKLRVVVQSLPSSLDFIDTIYHEHSLILRNLFQTIVRLNENGRIVGDLAKKWGISNGGRSYLFHLEDKFFHDGAKVTSKDVAITLSRQFWGSRPTMGKAYLQDIIEGSESVQDGEILSGLKIIDDQTIQVNLNKPYPAFLSILSVAALSVVKLSGNQVISGSGHYRLRIMSEGKWILQSVAENGNHFREVEILELADSPDKANADLMIVPSLFDIHPTGALTELAFTDVRGRNHLFFNSSGRHTGIKDFRRDIAGLVYHLTKISHDKSHCFEIEPFYFSRGILPTTYYERNPPDLSPKEFKEKWESKLGMEKFSLVIRKTFVSHQYIQILEEGLRKAGINLNLVLTNADEHREYIAGTKHYDLIIGAFVGSFPDPDGYLDPLLGTSGLHYGQFPVDGLREKLHKYKFLLSSEDRIKHYTAVMKDFEEEWFIIPLFSASLPILYKKNLVIPDVSLRFEFDIWKIRAKKIR